jgi:gamma-glutamylcyclotransferase (GGCT)/AIG2-like uncharacterized protein YtfP
VIHYFAYGSNLHPLRLSERVPSARLIGTVQLAGCRLQFHKRGGDSSGKCNIVHSGNVQDHVHGALYRMAAAHKFDLDQIEGVGCGYRDRPLRLTCLDRRYSCFTYIAEPTHIDDDLKPYHWYKALVVHGAEYLHLPGDYIAGLHAVDALEDPDGVRRADHEALVARMVRLSSPAVLT